MGDVGDNTCLDEENRRDLDHAMAVGLSRTRHQMLGDHVEGTLEKVEVERHLLPETTKGFKRAVADARAAGFTWEQITQRLPGLASTHGPHAAERLFEMVSVAGSGPGERYARWRCADCDGLVRHYGLYCGHSLGAEPGHRGHCERQPAAVSAYEAGLEADDHPAVGSTRAVSDHIGNLTLRAEPIELEGRGWNCEARVPPHEAGTQAHRRSL